ncbi:hypothetical protein CCR85_02525 [Rhodothalassium salexigens]|nr:hypothetical protein [Rhodothalassium salexigens]MBK5921022.1 hypothetical protein [Rhodothalassium salexigens]
MSTAPAAARSIPPTASPTPGSTWRSWSPIKTICLRSLIACYASRRPICVPTSSPQPNWWIDPMADIVLFGAGKVAEVADALFREAGDHRVVAFAVDRAYLDGPTFLGQPVVAFEQLAERYPPARVKAFVAIGYHALNTARAEWVAALEAQGYELVDCVSPRAWVAEGALTGPNCLVMPNAVVEPGARLGRDVVVWSNATIGHHARLDDHVWVAGNSVIGGGARLGAYTFAALGTVVGNEVTVGAQSFLGAGVQVTRCCADKSVFIQPDTEKYRLDSDRFLRISKLR